LARTHSEVSGIISLPAASPRRSEKGTLVAWLSLLLATAMYLTWWPVFLHLVPHAVDPAAERIALASLCTIFLAVGAIARYRRQIIALSHIALYITTVHFFSLLWRNDLAGPYVAAAFVFLAAVTLSFVTLRLLLAYGTCVVTLAIIVALHASDSGQAILLVVGVVSAVSMMSALSWRNLALQRAARNKVRSARDFLHAMVGAIPDPVFVLDDRLQPLLINDAMTAVSEGEALAILSGVLTEDLKTALASDEPVEREIPLGAGGSTGTGLVKLSSRLLGGRRHLIGVIRDISERKTLQTSLESKIHELQRAQTKVNQLQGLLPICMHCGRIRGDGDWQDLERYIESHSSAVFSHGLCDSCLATHYP
jgi:PAS domain-containing protein